MPLFAIAWLPCLIESASRLTLEWLSASAKMPQWLLAQDFDPPTWLTAFAVTPWAAMAWAFVLSGMADAGSKRGTIQISGTPVRWARLEFSPAVLVAAVIFSATNLVDAALRFAERSVPPLLLGDAGLSDLGFDIWGISVVVAHIVAMAAVMACAYPVAGLVLRTGKFDISAARRVLQGDVVQITAIFVLLTLVLVALDRVLDVPKAWLLRLLMPATPWNLGEALIRYMLDFPLSMVMIVSWAVAVGIMLDKFMPPAPASCRRVGKGAVDIHDSRHTSIKSAVPTRARTAWARRTR
ncbi:MAG TPA: hypothetical protein VH684_22255 [Xanthobacteraceae bacterium]